MSCGGGGGVCIDNLFQSEYLWFEKKKKRVESLLWKEPGKDALCISLQRELALVVILMPCGMTGAVKTCCGGGKKTFTDTHKRKHTSALFRNTVPLKKEKSGCNSQTTWTHSPWSVNSGYGFSRGNLSDGKPVTQWRVHWKHPQEVDHLGGRERIWCLRTRYEACLQIHGPTREPNPNTRCVDVRKYGGLLEPCSFLHFVFVQIQNQSQTFCNAVLVEYYVSNHSFNNGFLMLILFSCLTDRLTNGAAVVWWCFFFLPVGS